VPVSHDQLVEAIEASLFLYSDTPGYVEPLSFAGVTGRVTRLSHPLANMVGMSTLDDASADMAIAQVHEFFVGQGKAYSWLVAPSSTPADLGRRLETVGMVKFTEMAGMVLTQMDRPMNPNPQVEVREAIAEERRRAIPLMVEGYPLPEAVATLFAEMMMSLDASGKVLSRDYLAYVPERAEPVAWSALMHVPNSSIVVLSGAATLPNFRGRGIYTAMVARRLADARAAGAEAAIIQAVRDTSAPICVKNGFTEVTALDLYAWIPPGEDGRETT